MCRCGLKEKTNLREYLGCEVNYSALKEFDTKVLLLLRRIKSSTLRQANKKIRIWIKEYNFKCPPLSEVEVLQKFIEDEYSEYTQ